ncbi:protein mono-ADP-ribosyltransferase PARP14-like [Ranitomeya variabilis]|uniref:protein mono-ADP-ribosyltransferase PARP14-like n=1 Tax=Ranitomeya variabilis TaxID=490064 RepID=UPI00405697F8
MGDRSYQFPLSVQWDEGPENLKGLKNKLLLHFQSKKKSNGGECEIREEDGSRGYILIHFREEEVRDNVLWKENHKLKITDGKTINLRVTLPTSSPDGAPNPGVDTDGRTPDVSSSVVFIQNVQDSCTSDMLNLLVENLSARSQDQDFHVERIPELQSAAITFTCDQDIHHFMQIFSTNLRVTQLKLKAKLLEETTTIRVENLPPNTSKEDLSFFFESPRLGGGKVQETEMFPEEGAALLKFSDTDAVKMIIKKQLVFNKTAISAYRYYPSLRLHLYGAGEPDVTIPSPKEFSISPYILELILGNEQTKVSIEAKMAKKYCKMKWPSPDCLNPIVTIEISKNLSARTMAKVVHTWTEEVSTEFSLFISKYKVIDCKMNPSAWEDLKDQISTAAYDGVLIKHNPEVEKIFLAGTMKDVNKIEQTFRKLVEETSRKVERRSKVITMTEPLSAALYHIIHSSGLESKILADVPELGMEYDPTTHNLRLTGLREEVLQAKCEIMSAKQQLKTKYIHLDPYVHQFLMFADNDEVSCLLFARHKINALIEMEENSIQLTGHSKKDMMDAEEQINRELICQRIPVTAKKILESPEWRSLQSHLQESFNSEMCTVMIQAFPSGAENDVVLAGMSTNVQLCYKQIKGFVDTHTVMEVTVPIRSTIMLQFMEEEMTQAWQKITAKVKVVKNENSVSLLGPRVQAEDAAAQVRSLLSTIYCDSLRINKPGAKKFCASHEEVHATTAKTKFHCVIRLETGGDNRLDEGQYEVKLQSGVTIAVYKDNLCRHNVDVIVNAANEDLQHCGGLAEALLKAAGPKLQDDCNLIIKSEGKLAPGDSVITDAGKLPCKQVIHTVGPRWDRQSHVRCERLLRRAITTSLELASENGHSSIAIPAVSSGIFGFPLQECARNILDAIMDYVEKGSATCLQRIHLVDMNVQTTNIFSELLKSRFGEKKLTVASTTSGPPTPIRQVKSAKPQVTASRDVDEVWTPEGLIIRLVQKKIQDATTDVIVNSVAGDLDLTKGEVSNSLYRRAGAGLQQVLADSTAGTTVSRGTVIATHGCGLSCKSVLHAVAPAWDNGRGSAETVLRGVIQDCLTWTDRQQMKSLSIPALGTGNLAFPKDFVAALMLDEMSQFSSKNKPQNLKEVEIVLHPKDKDTIQAFTDCLASSTDGGSSGKKQSYKSGSIFCGTVTNPSLGVHEMRIGALTFQIRTGDITKEGADVLVNSSNHSFTLYSGVSKAILDAAGPSVQSVAKILGSQPHKGYILTDSGNLAGSNWILHVSGPKQPADIKKMVLSCLQACEAQQAASVAFPALGTGAGGLAAAVVGDAILGTVMDFISSGSVRSIQMVKVVIFQQHMLNDFYTSMKKMEGTALTSPRSFIGRLTDLFRLSTFMRPTTQKKPVQKLTAFQLLDNLDPVVFSLCSNDQEKIVRSKQWLQQQIEQEQTEITLTDESVAELEDGDYQKILALQRKFQVSVVYRPPDPSIHISGLTRDVLCVNNEIQKIVNCLKDRKSRERAAELTANLVEWRHQHGANMAVFEDMANLELEEARNANKSSVTVQSCNQKITVDLKNLTATDSHGNRITIERVLKHEETSLKLPDLWQPMNSSPVMEVDVPAGSAEYLQVQQLFAQTCRSQIVKIQRVQNKDLWLNYQIKKQSIEAKSRSAQSERRLFHGTDLRSIQHINHNGFNRSYAGRHAAMYGNGTYFAVAASYSAQSFSPADSRGQKHLYLARVLTGEFCAGQRGMLAPPAKNAANITDLYDSVTDNPARPTMFIIFNDIQAYPEYHITFC